MTDMVNHPPHYIAHPSGVECIEIVESLGFLVGNAIKYLWRYELKYGLEDLQKARWYIERELDRLREDQRSVGFHTVKSDQAFAQWDAYEQDGPLRYAIARLYQSVRPVENRSDFVRSALQFVSDLIFEEVKKRAIL